MLNDWVGGAYLFPLPRRAGEETIIKWLIEGNLQYLADLEHLAAVPTGHVKKNAAFRVGMELVFIGPMGQPVRPKLSARPRDGAQPDTTAPGRLRRTRLLQTKAHEVIPQRRFSKVAFDIGQARRRSSPTLYPACFAGFYVPLVVATPPLVAIHDDQREFKLFLRFVVLLDPKSTRPADPDR